MGGVDLLWCQIHKYSNIIINCIITGMLLGNDYMYLIKCHFPTSRRFDIMFHRMCRGNLFNHSNLDPRHSRLNTSFPSQEGEEQKIKITWKWVANCNCSLFVHLKKIFRWYEDSWNLFCVNKKFKYLFYFLTYKSPLIFEFKRGFPNVKNYSIEENSL